MGFWTERVGSLRHPTEPSITTYYFLAPLQRERRFLDAKGDPVPYMEQHREFVYGHIKRCVEFTAALFGQNPELKKAFNKSLVMQLLWHHEVIEILEGDKSWYEKLKDGTPIGGTNDTIKRQALRDKLEDLFSIRFSDERKIKYWVRMVDQFENYGFANNASVLLAKLIDVMVGDETVLLHGNNLPANGEGQKESVGPRLDTIMGRIFNTKAMRNHPTVMNYLDSLVEHHVSEYERKGIHIPYVQRRFTQELNN